MHHTWLVKRTQSELAARIYSLSKSKDKERIQIKLPMAWLSVGISNEDLCNKLIQYGILKDNQIIEAFMHTDRGDFVLDEDRQLAYQDRPYKHGQIHLSAPHMYATVLEALDLHGGQTFLNVGSGSGYLSCLAAKMLGPTGVSVGIEINTEACEHSRNCISKWERQLIDKETSPSIQREISICPITICEGNCFNIDVNTASNTCLYDRIYVGAGCPNRYKNFFYSLLADNGVLVVPIIEKNEMILVKKLAGKVFLEQHVSSVHFAPLVQLPTSVHHGNGTSLSDTITNTSSDLRRIEHEIYSCETGLQIVSDTARRSLFSSTSTKVCLPSVIWAPVKSRHLQFPPSFRDTVKLILLTCRYCEPSSSNSRERFSRCAKLPVVLWYHIFTFAARDWFVAPKSPLELLQIELMAERKLRQVAEEKLTAAVNGKRAAARERDLLRIVVARLGHSRPDSLFYDGYEDEEQEEEQDEEEEDIELHEIADIVERNDLEEVHVVNAESNSDRDSSDDEEDDEEEHWGVPIQPQPQTHNESESINTDNEVRIALENTMESIQSSEMEASHDSILSASNGSTSSEISDTSSSTSFAHTPCEDPTPCTNSSFDESTKSSSCSEPEKEQEQASVIAHRRQMKAMSLSSLDTDHESDEDLPMQICI